MLIIIYGDNYSSDGNYHAQKILKFCNIITVTRHIQTWDK